MAAIAMSPRVKGAGTMERALRTDSDYAEDMAEGGAEDDNDEGGLDDTEILAMLELERQNSVGFENGTELDRKRKQALEYSKGVMADVQSLPNRSKAVSTDIAEAVETILPDLMDIFTGGEDIATFIPVGEEDVERAEQETNWVNHVAFGPGGFLVLYQAIKDALQVDTGIIYTYWQDNETTEDEEVFGVTAPQLEMAEQSGAEIVSSSPGQPLEMEGGELETFNAVLRKKYDRGCLKFDVVDPANLTVAQDATLDLNKAVYFCIRAFPRAQALIDMGFDPELVEKLPAYTRKSGNEDIELARDVAGETDSAVDGMQGGGRDDGEGKSLLRTVEVHKHFLRADIDGSGKSQLWKIETDADCSVILAKAKIDRSGVSVGTPFIQAHRFYGMSLAEKLVEIQKIKTALLRMMLDSGYFAMNQRTEIAMDRANEHTIADLMRNEPMSPVRSRTGDAVRPLQAGQLGFDVNSALEYVSTMGEQRTGIIRGMQGLNPDTLHDTKGGMQALLTQAQKRIRMIARILAETLVKGWLLDIHALSRKHQTQPDKVRLSGKFVDIDPSSFGDRSDMVIEVGVGSGGKEMELATLTRVMDVQEKLIMSGKPEYAEMAAPQQVWNAATRMISRAGFKAPEMFLENPEAIARRKAEEKQMRAEQGIPEPEAPPSPEEMKVKGELEMKAKAHQDQMALEDKRIAVKGQADQQAAALKAQQDAAQAERDLQMERERMAMDAQLRREQMAGELALKREQMTLEIELKRQQLNAELQMNMDLEKMKIAAGVYTKTSEVSTTGVNLGGEAGA